MLVKYRFPLTNHYFMLLVGIEDMFLGNGIIYGTSCRIALASEISEELVLGALAVPIYPGLGLGIALTA